MTYLNDARQRASRRLEDVLEVLAAGGGLVRDAALDEVACGVAGDLAGDEDGAAGLDGLRLCVRAGDVSQGKMLTHVLMRNFMHVRAFVEVDNGRRQEGGGAHSPMRRGDWPKCPLACSSDAWPSESRHTDRRLHDIKRESARRSWGWLVIFRLSVEADGRPCSVGAKTFACLATACLAKAAGFEFVTWTSRHASRPCKEGRRSTSESADRLT
jgi:hypothetical protein